jgi:hypothetical protein
VRGRRRPPVSSKAMCISSSEPSLEILNVPTPRQWPEILPFPGAKSAIFLAIAPDSRRSWWSLRCAQASALALASRTMGLSCRRSGVGRVRWSERRPANDWNRRRAADTLTSGEWPKLPLKRPCRRDRGTARSGGKASFPICPTPMCACFESGRSLPEARTPDAAPISALPLVGRKAEGYHRRRGVAASLSRGSPHGRSGVATGFGP